MNSSENIGMKFKAMFYNSEIGLTLSDLYNQNRTNGTNRNFNHANRSRLIGLVSGLA